MHNSHVLLVDGHESIRFTFHLINCRDFKTAHLHLARVLEFYAERSFAAPSSTRP